MPWSVPPVSGYWNVRGSARRCLPTTAARYGRGPPPIVMKSPPTYTVLPSGDDRMPWTASLAFGLKAVSTAPVVVDTAPIRRVLVPASVPNAPPT